MTKLSDDVIKNWDVECTRHVIGLAKETVTFLNPERQYTVLDVGSNIGKFIELISEHVSISDAILIEPIPQLLEYSKHKFPDNYIYINGVVGNVPEPVCLYFDQTPINLGLSRVIKENNNMTDESLLRFTSINLSDLLLQSYPALKPDLIKIDAEGYDILILEGLLRYIDHDISHRPIIIFEVAGSTDIKDITAKYNQYGYTTFSSRAETVSRDIFLLPPSIS